MTARQATGRRSRTRGAPIGFKIRARRKALGLTQAALAQRVGISASYLNLIEANKRAVGGRLLARTAEALGVGLDALDGAAERGLMEELGALATHPMVHAFAPEPGFPAEAVARHPGWARAIVAVYRAYLDGAEAVGALSDRLRRDPALRDAVHQMLTQVTAIRSTAEILEQVRDLDADQERRFLGNLSAESARLSQVARSLAAFFDKEHTKTRSATAAEEVEDFIIGRGAHFPDLEAAGAELARAVAPGGEPTESALADHLDRVHGVAVTLRAPGEVDLADFRGRCRFDAGARELVFLDNCLAATRRFQLARVAGELAHADEIRRIVHDSGLEAPETRAQATRALGAYLAAAALFPYDAFLADAVRVRYDVELLRRRYGASFEQICHRLVTLRRPAAEGVPFAFLRADPAGFVSKRFPLHGLPIPRRGHLCPLWAVFAAFQTPDRMVRQLAGLPDGGRFLFVARTVAKQPATFHEHPFLYAVMLACDVLYADETVYGDGLDRGRADAVAPVGSTCRLCPRRGCGQRQEDAIVYTSGHSPAGPDPGPIQAPGARRDEP